jgi:hypothetical protein
MNCNNYLVMWWALLQLQRIFCNALSCFPSYAMEYLELSTNHDDMNELFIASLFIFSFRASTHFAYACIFFCASFFSVYLLA